jgi:hypothetical protein
MKSIIPGLKDASAVSTPATSNLTAMLTQASRYAVSYKEYAVAIDHALESWPLALHELSFPSLPIELEQHTVLIIEQLWAEVDFGFETYPDASTAWSNAQTIIAGAVYTGGGYREKLTDIDAIRDLLTEIDTTIAQLTEDGYERPLLKLGTMSPKDSCFWPVSKGRVDNSAQALLLILTSARMLTNIANDAGYQSAAATARSGKRDPRMTDDAFEAALNVPFHLPVIWLRAFESFKPHQEFRCFVKDGAFLGGTQYHRIISDPRGRFFEALPFPDLVERGYEYERLILQWVPKFLASSPYRDVVFDVIVDVDANSVRLIETNPFANSTFPGLFRWSSTFRKDSSAKLLGTDGSIVWVDEPYHAVEPHISAREIEEIRARAAITTPSASFESMKTTSAPPPLAQRLFNLARRVTSRLSQSKHVKHGE